jgi:hypothetical protein
MAFVNADKKSEGGRGSQKNYGTYVGIVKNHADPYRRGRLKVFIKSFGGIEDNESHWITVSYANPYMGAARSPSKSRSTTNDFTHTNHSYGMWFTPPDIGNTVLVTFIDGDLNQGFWFACINTDVSHWAMPGQAGAVNLEKHSDPAIAAALTTPPYPSVEFNEENSDLSWANFVSLPKPVHEHQVKILLDQGLEDDKVRGVISSSSQRESPSRVFGISTPGKDGPTPHPDSLSPYYRLGGHTFVMDDGDENGKDQLIRLRTAGGHQILMNDTENILYVGNSKGTVWMEFTGDGKINVFSESDINIRTNSNLNIHADKSINMFAGEDIKMFAGKSIQEESDKISIKAITELKEYGGKIGVMSGSAWNVKAGTEGTIWTGTEIIAASGKIYLNTKPGTDVTKIPAIPPVTHSDAKKEVFKWTATGKVSSTIPASMPIPTHEPSAAVHNLPPPTTSAPVSTAPPATTTTAPALGLGGGSTNLTDIPLLQGAYSAAGKGITNPATAADLASQPANLAGIGSLAATEVTALKAQIGKSESGGNYSAVNQLGYLGKYQMGAPALIDQGFVKPGTTNSGLTDPANWTGKDGVTSKEAFLAAPDIQEKAMDGNLQANYNALMKKGTINRDTPNEDISGKLAVAHLLGAGGTNQWAMGKGGSDANGTTGDTYYNRGRYANTVLARANTSSPVAVVSNGKITPVG